MSQINAFKYNVPSIPSMSATHSAVVLLLTIRVIFVDDQERMQFLLFCKNIYPPALDPPSHNGWIRNRREMRIYQSAFVYFNFFQ